MGKLTAKQRKSIPSADFGLPKLRKYPMPDAAHAANAKSRAKQQFNKGKLGGTDLEKIDTMANRKLGNK